MEHVIAPTSDFPCSVRGRQDRARGRFPPLKGRFCRVRDFAGRGFELDAPLDVPCSALYMRGMQGCCSLSDTFSRRVRDLPEVITVVEGAHMQRQRLRPRGEHAFGR